MCLVWLVWLVWCDWCGSPLCEVPQSVDNWLVWRGGHSWSAGRPHTRARDQVGPGQGSVTSGEVPLPPSSPPPVSRHWGPCREGSRDRAGLFLPCHQIHGTSSVDTPSHLNYYIYGPPTPSHLHHHHHYSFLLFPSLLSATMAFINQLRARLYKFCKQRTAGAQWSLK